MKSVQKEDVRGLYNSQQARINIVLLFLIVLVFVLASLSAEALTITGITPGNLSFNGSKSINFTFTPKWSDSNENISNCSIFMNSTSTGGVWGIIRNMSTTTTSSDAIDTRILNNSISYANFTLNADGNFTFNIGCLNNNLTTPGFNFSGGVGGTGNRTFFIDTVAPQITGVYPGDVFGPGPWANYTSFPIYINVSVLDNSTNTVWYIINSLPGGAGTNETVGGKIQNNTMSTVPGAQGQNITYYANISLNNFTSSWRGPGAHSVFFCANDTIGRVTCTSAYDLAIIGMNVTQLIDSMSQFGFTPPGATASLNVGLNITYGNGSVIPFSTFLNPLTQNFTFIFNMSGSGNKNKFIQIVGMQIDEGKLANTSNSNFTTTFDSTIQAAVGSRMNVSMGWADIASFLPSFVSYTFGVIQIPGIGFDKHMYCNGTSSVTSPNCMPITRCNATVFSSYNTSTINNVIPTSEPRACWLEGDKVNLTYGLTDRDRDITYTYIFVRKFSGAIGGNDTGVPDINFTTPVPDLFNTTVATSRLINFTVEDINSTGINLTRNSTINLSIYLGQTKIRFFSYINDSSTNLTCTTADTTSPANTSLATCNATFNFASNGTYAINVTAIDASNNTNYQFNATRLTVDQIPPIFAYYNFTNQSLFSNGTQINGNGSAQLGTSDAGVTVTTLQGRTIFAIANWNDNLTQPLVGLLQFFNQTANSGTGAWQTLNVTFVNSTLNFTSANMNTSNYTWSNFSFPIPTANSNEFEGKNVSFRIVANDTLGNVNTSNIVKNFTIQVNDTAKPVISISQTNFTNYSTNRDLAINWSVREGNFLVSVNWSVDNEKQAEEAGSGCNDFGKFNSQATAEAKRNHNFTLFPSSTTCTEIANGTHYLVINARDSWNNIDKFNYTFTVLTGVIPIINLSDIRAINVTSSTSSTFFDIANKTSVRSNNIINFSANLNSTGVLATMSFTSSCNSTGGTFTNNTGITPFADPSCTGASANRTVSVTATATSGASTTNIFTFNVDDVAPLITVQDPRDGATISGLVPFNWSVRDESINISFAGYYLDGSVGVTQLNFSATGIGTPSTNITFNSTTANLTPGTHTVKLTVNDTLGNQRNTSVITFTVTGPADFGTFSNSTSAYTSTIFNNNITNVTYFFKTPDGTYNISNTTTDVSSNTFQILFTTGRDRALINISLTEINGSAANWDKTNFTPFINQTNFVQGLQQNWTNTILGNGSVWFNTSINEFISNNNSYYGIVVLPLNLSGVTATAQQFWWIPDIFTLTSKQNISKCTGGFGPTSTTPCWNYTSGGRTIIQVPHFSIVVAVNDSTAPNISVTSPLAAQDQSTFVPNISVSADAINCSVLINGTGTSETTMTLSTSTFVCTSSQISSTFINFTNSSENVYNVTYRVSDASANTRQLSFLFSVNDTTPQNISSISIGSISDTSAKVTVTANESVNMSVNSTGTNSFTNPSAVTTFSKTQSITISSLTASKIYNLTVITCDAAGNCMTNLSLGFTTSAAAAAAAASTSSSGGGGSAAGGATTPVTTVASVAAVWDTIASGSTKAFAISNDQIAFTGVVIAASNALTSPSMTVDSLTSNPQSTGAAAKVYQYLQITTSHIADSDLSTSTINFKVPKSWLATNGVQEADVVLYRYNSGKWNALPTAQTGADANDIMYSATTPGFSVFAVGSKEAAPTTAPITQPTAPTTPTTPTAPTAGGAAAGGLSSTTLAWIVVAAIVAIGLVFFFVRRSKSQGQ